MHFIRTLALAIVFSSVAVTSHAATTTYSDGTAYDVTVAGGTTIVDGYNVPPYGLCIPFQDCVGGNYSDSQMSAIVGQTDYVATGVPASSSAPPPNNVHLIGFYNVNCFFLCGNGAPYYAPQASVRLEFGSTSVTSPGGTVFGFAFSAYNYTPLSMRIVFGDDTFLDETLPVSPLSIPGFSFIDQVFFGITSDLGIRSVHLGGAGGASTSNLDLLVSGLSVSGAQAVPLPAGLWLLLSGAGALGTLARRRVRRSDLVAAG